MSLKKKLKDMNKRTKRKQYFKNEKENDKQTILNVFFKKRRRRRRQSKRRSKLLPYIYKTNKASN